MEGGSERVLLMTLHAAKGLEFSHVTIAGMEDRLFPSDMSIWEAESGGDALEEERRLAYVGFTRAKKRLTLTAARSRMTHGEIRYSRVSRFVEEIPPELINDKTGGNYRNNEYTIPDEDDDFREISSARPKAIPKKVTKQAPFIAGAARGMNALHKGAPPPVEIAYEEGDRVRHLKWGDGEVVSMEKGARDTKVEVRFDDGEVRIMYAAFAKLEKL